MARPTPTTRLLLNELADIEVGLARAFRSGIPAAHGCALDDASDFVTDSNDRDDAFRNLERLRLRRSVVVAALQRIDTDRYGVCVWCDARIPASRLKAMPTAERCVPCQHAYERGES